MSTGNTTIDEYTFPSEHDHADHSCGHDDHSHVGAEHSHIDAEHSNADAEHSHSDAQYSHADAEQNHGHAHHVHSDAEKKAVQNRLSRAIGHLNKVKSMVDEDADCSEVLIQLAAVRNAINNTGKLVLKNHMNHCIVHAIEDGDTETIEALNHAIDQFMK